MTTFSKKPVCWLCNRPIKGKVYHQAGVVHLPSHKKCLIVIKKSEGGGV